MEDKNNAQEDLVVSATGQMLQGGEDVAQIDVKPAPEETPDDNGSDAASTPDGSTTEAAPAPTGLAPPTVPSPQPAEATSNTQLEQPAMATSDAESKDVGTSHSKTDSKDKKANDEAFAKHHTSVERGANQKSHNNKKVVASIIIIVTVVLCGLVVFLYYATQENVAEVQKSNTIDGSVTENQTRDSDAAESGSESLLPVDTADDMLTDDTMVDPTLETPTDQSTSVTNTDDTTILPDNTGGPVTQ